MQPAGWVLQPHCRASEATQLLQLLNGVFSVMAVCLRHLSVFRRITAAELYLSLPHGILPSRTVKTWCGLLQAAAQGQGLTEPKGNRWGASYPMQLRILFTR